MTVALRLLDKRGRMNFLSRPGARFWRYLQPLQKRLLPADRAWRRIALGMLWGWLPCGLSMTLLTAAWLQASARDGAPVSYTHLDVYKRQMFVFLLLAARMLEQRARNIATAQVDALARARPAFATRERADGERESVPLTALQIDDIVRVAAGESVPADGVLLDTQAMFEEALLTGESSPVSKAVGAPVYAGTNCREHPARLRVTEVGSATRLSQLARLVDPVSYTHLDVYKRQTARSVTAKWKTATP